MPPGRILALSFVLALCKVSRTDAPLVADSLLNFMSGSVRTNTLKVTSATPKQPILLLTGADLESEDEVGLVIEVRGSMTYTLTGQWQHGDEPGDVVHLTDSTASLAACAVAVPESSATCVNATGRPEVPVGPVAHRERVASDRFRIHLQAPLPRARACRRAEEEQIDRYVSMHSSERASYERRPFRRQVDFWAFSLTAAVAWDLHPREGAPSGWGKSVHLHQSGDPRRGSEFAPRGGRGREARS